MSGGDRTRTLVAGLLLGTALLVACRPEPPEERALDVVRLVTQKRFTNIPLLIADASGFFAREGIRIERVPLDSGSDALPLLIRGQVDAAAMASTVNLLSAIDRGAPIRLVANKGSYEAGHCSNSGLLVRPDWAPPQDPEGLRDYLRGRRIATSNSMGTSWILKAFLDQVGLGSDEVESLTVPQAGKAAALRRGTIDLAFVGEPSLTHMVDQGFLLWWETSELFVGRDVAFVVFAPSLLTDRRDVGVRFLRAYLAAIADYREGKSDERVALVARETGLSPDLVRRACWPAVRASGEIDLETIRRVGTWAVDQGFLDRAPAPEAVVDRSILAEARSGRRADP